MALAQFKGLDIHSHKFIDHRSKINILSIQENKFDALLKLRGIEEIMSKLIR
jgi:hypothetical protein